MATKKATPEAQASEKVHIDKLARMFRRISDRIAVVKSKHDKELEALEDQLTVVKDAINENLKEQNASSVKTPFGLVIKTTTTNYNTNDWDGFKQFLIKHDAVDLLQKRIAQTNMAEFRAKNPKLLPPGLYADSKVTISVRKPKAPTTPKGI